MAKWIEKGSTRVQGSGISVCRLRKSLVLGNAATVVLRSYHCQGRRMLIHTNCIIHFIQQYLSY